MSRNDITGDQLQSKFGNQEAYSTGYDAIFGHMKVLPLPDPEDEPNGVETCFHWCAGWQQPKHEI